MDSGLLQVLEQLLNSVASAALVLLVAGCDRQICAVDDGVIYPDSKIERSLSTPGGGNRYVAWLAVI